MTRAKDATARAPRPSSPLRKEYYEILCDAGVVEDAEKTVASINTMSAADLRQAIAASRDDVPMRRESKYLIAESLDDIASYFEVHATREESKSTERTMRAQAYRNGLVHAYRDCATSMRLMQLRPKPVDTSAALKQPDGKLPTAEPSYTIEELIAFLRGEHVANKRMRTENLRYLAKVSTPGEIADWLELYFEKELILSVDKTKSPPTLKALGD